MPFKQGQMQKAHTFPFEPRHKDNSKFENEARKEFNDVVVAKGLMEMEI